MFRQRQTGTFMGAIKIIISNISPYAGWLSLALIGVMSFYTTISPILAERGMVLSFWVFCLILALIVVAMAIFEWIFMLPSFYRANNVQAWESGGPIRDIFETIERGVADVREEVADVKERLIKLQNQIGRENTMETIEMSHLPAVYGIKEGAEEFPLMIVVDVSYACNAKCPHCPYTQSASIRKSYGDTPFMSPEVFKKIARECGEFGSLLRITGGGEPLLHPQIIELIEYAKSVNARVGLITNGSLLTPDKVDRMLDIGIDAIDISADAADRETYAKIRVGLNFNEMVRNVRYLVERRNDMSGNTKIIASIIDQKALFNKLETTVTFWENIVDNVQVRKYLTWDDKYASESGDTTPFIVDRVPCPYPFERIEIDSRGKVLLCSHDVAGETNFGNVMDKSISSIWTGEKLNLYRKLLLEGRYSEIGVCSKCSAWKYISWNYNYQNVLKVAEQKRANK